jgi:hypothetical protein
VNVTEDKDVVFKYIEAATKMGQLNEVERVCRENRKFCPLPSFISYFYLPFPMENDIGSILGEEFWTIEALLLCPSSESSKHHLPGSTWYHDSRLVNDDLGSFNTSSELLV